MALALLSAGFQSLPLIPTINLGPSGADSWMGRFVYVLGPCGSLQQNLLWGWEFLPLPPQPLQVFSVRGFEVLFPCAGPLGCSVYLAPRLFLLVYLHLNVGPPSLQAKPLQGPPAATLPWVLSAQLLVSAPPTCLNECFFFNSLVVGLPYRLIFCQFWLLFVFKFVVVLLLSVWGGTVCLPTPPSWPEVLEIWFLIPENQLGWFDFILLLLIYNISFRYYFPLSYLFWIIISPVSGDHEGSGEVLREEHALEDW